MVGRLLTQIFPWTGAAHCTLNTTFVVLQLNTQGIRLKIHLLDPTTFSENRDIILLQKTFVQKEHCFELKGYPGCHMLVIKCRIILLQINIPSVEPITTYCREYIEVPAIRHEPVLNITFTLVYEISRGSLDTKELYSLLKKIILYLGGDSNVLDQEMKLAPT